MLDQLATNVNWAVGSLKYTPKLEPNDIHLWLLPLQITEQQQIEAMTWLNDQQQSKYEKRAYAGKQNSYLAARYFLYQLISGYSGLPIEEIQLNYSRLNKPYLKQSGCNLFFNFSDTTSDSGPVGVFAFSRSGEIGIDLESLDRSGNFSAIAQKRFTPFEQSLVKNENGAINNETFLCLWTRKEASGKATGQGINFKMNQRSTIESLSPTHCYMDEFSTSWTLQQLRLSETLIGCVAHEGTKTKQLSAFKIYTETLLR